MFLQIAQFARSARKNASHPSRSGDIIIVKILHFFRQTRVANSVMNGSQNASQMGSVDYLVDSSPPVGHTRYSNHHQYPSYVSCPYSARLAESTLVVGQPAGDAIARLSERRNSEAHSRDNGQIEEIDQ